MKTENKETPKVKLSDISVSKMNPRKVFAEDDLKELTASIKSEGLIQPILIRPKGEKYELVCGERRFRAHLLIQKEDKNFDSIEVKIKEMKDEEALSLMITENLQRVNVTVMEEAAGFKTLMDFKKYNTKEIALLVGKPETYVAQRLKMNDLSENYQKALHNERLKIQDANFLCRLSLEDQEAIWKEEGHGSKYNLSDPIDLEEVREHWAGDLSNAPFDITSTKINEKMGACTVCPFNSANTPTLFPELKKGEATCQKKSCFLVKTNAGFKDQLAKALEDPAVILFSDQYSNETALTKKYNSEGFKTCTEYNSNSSEKGRPGAVKCFCIEGDEKGKYVYRTLHRSESASKSEIKTSKENIAEGKASAQDIANEIKGMQEREKRKKELDENKILMSVFEMLGKGVDNYTKQKVGLTLAEKRALIIILLKESRSHSVDHAAEKYFKKHTGLSDDYGTAKLFNALKKLNAQQINDFGNIIARCMIMEKLQAKAEMFPSKSDYAAAIMDIAQEQKPKETKEIVDAQNAIAATRDERIKQRIASLKNIPIKKKKPEVQGNPRTQMKYLEDKRKASKSIKKKK